MPFYEYQCEACGRDTEVMQKISDVPMTDCPACGKPALKRLISAPVFRLKGSGWYETDFKTDKDNKRNLAEKGDADSSGDVKKDEKKEDKKADSAPAATPAAASAGDKPAKAAEAGSSKPAAAPTKTESKPATESKPKSSSEAKKSTSTAKAAD